MDKLETLKKSADELVKIAKDVQETGKMEEIDALERRGVEDMRAIEAALAYAGRGFYDIVQGQRRAITTGEFKPKAKATKAEEKPAKKTTKKSK